MKAKRVAPIALGVLVLSVTVGMTVGTAVAKKKSNKATVTKNVNAVIPDRSAVAPTTFGRLEVTLPIGGKFKGRTVAADSVKVTVQASGTVANAADDLQFFIASPKGRTVRLLPDRGTLGGQSIGPLTFSPNSSVGTCNLAVPPCADPFQSLIRPFVGTVGDSSLGLFTGVGMKGNWKLTVLDDTTTKSSTLNSVKLEVTAAS